MHNPFANFSNEQLEAMAVRAREMAGMAPKSLPGTMGDVIEGDAQINSSDAWARFSSEWTRIKAEIDRRRATAS